MKKYSKILSCHIGMERQLEAENQRLRDTNEMLASNLLAEAENAQRLEAENARLREALKSNISKDSTKPPSNSATSAGRKSRGGGAMGKCKNDFPHGDHELSKTHICPNHGRLLKCEIDEGGACLVCKEFFLVVEIQRRRRGE
jgi:hypothetical protein